VRRCNCRSAANRALVHAEQLGDTHRGDAVREHQQRGGALDDPLLGLAGRSAPSTFSRSSAESESGTIGRPRCRRATIGASSLMRRSLHDPRNQREIFAERN